MVGGAYVLLWHLKLSRSKTYSERTYSDRFALAVGIFRLEICSFLAAVCLRLCVRLSCVLAAWHGCSCSCFVHIGGDLEGGGGGSGSS